MAVTSSLTFFFIIVSSPLSVETVTTAGIPKKIEIDYRLMCDLNKSFNISEKGKVFHLTRTSHDSSMHVVSSTHILSLYSKCSFSA